MPQPRDKYENPLCGRYAGEQMQKIFSPDAKFKSWRKLWIALAESEKELGLDITDAQVDELKKHADNINYDDAEKREREVRHDVMSHIYAYGLQCPTAKPIIHLGATSCYVGDNTDILTMKAGLIRIRTLIINTLSRLYEFSNNHKNLPCLAFTHFQAAQPTTLGKRAALWIQDLVSDLDKLDYTISNLKLLGCRGATGTAASFLELFGGDSEKVLALDNLISQRLGMSVCDVSGQTYSRKTDYDILSVLSGIAQSAHKFSNDVRLLSHLKEVDEPFESGQVGSSAMAYKKNPMRSERIASLSRYIMTTALNPAFTASAQWFERTLDDSANKRISIPEAFLACDAVLLLYADIISGMTVYPKMMEKHLKEEMPFMATENILMHCVKNGGDRQELHERIRTHSNEAAKMVKLHGKDNDLLERIAQDPLFNLTKKEIERLADPKKFMGLAALQTKNYLKKVKKFLDKNSGVLTETERIRV